MFRQKEFWVAGFTFKCLLRVAGALALSSYLPHLFCGWKLNYKKYNVKFKFLHNRTPWMWYTGCVSILKALISTKINSIQ